MLFNSIDFAVFLPIVFLLYWLVAGNNQQFQNLLIVIASYVFYGWWDWRFLFLIFFSTCIDYFIGIKLKNEAVERNRKVLLWISLIINLSILGIFKYYNFFIENFVTAFSVFGVELKAHSLNIILPVGISFYTFQTLSYAIDVYKRKLTPNEDFIAFTAFVSFFPQLVAGPIERAQNLLPQFHKSRSFDYTKATDGMRQILWGLFKKIVIADNCAVFADQVFNNSAEMNGSTLILGVLFFAFQIYGDFSGYSDIAIGTAKLFGIHLMKNFAFPYFSRDIAEFWRRWHISLSSWFRDYVYIPLGGSHGSIYTKVRNVLIIFILSAFWHGAKWTFMAWGVLHAFYFLPLLLNKSHRKHVGVVAKSKRLPSLREFFQITTTFGLTILAWVFFRAESMSQAINMFSTIFSASLFEFPDFWEMRKAIPTIILTIIFVLIEWQGREQEFAIEKLSYQWKTPFRYAFYYLLVFTIFWFGGKEQAFIYFQF